MFSGCLVRCCQVFWVIARLLLTCPIQNSQSMYLCCARILVSGCQDNAIRDSEQLRGCTGCFCLVVVVAKVARQLHTGPFQKYACTKLMLGCCERLAGCCCAVVSAARKLLGHFLMLSMVFFIGWLLFVARVLWVAGRQFNGSIQNCLSLVLWCQDAWML